jgi:hypothetical protein
MIRVSLPYIFELCARLDALSTLPNSAKVGDLFIPLITAATAIGELYGAGSLYGPYLRSSVASASQLNESINHITTKNWDDDVTFYEIANVKSRYTTFRTAFTAELGILNCYFVTQKGGYDMLSLLAWGENLFPTDLYSKVPEAQFDVREAGRCLAYELPTASAFHVFRATESILRRYYDHISNKATPPKVRSIGVYVAAMRRANIGNPKVTSSLSQMANLHRNPLIHPEAAISVDEAISIYGIARSAASAMLAELPVATSTTLTPPGSAQTPEPLAVPESAPATPAPA